MSRRLIGTICVAALLVAACGTDGRQLREPAVSPPDAAGADDQPEAGSEPESTRGEFVFSSPAFPSGGAIPVAHTCDGDDTSPALSWTGVPVGAAELAVVVADPQADFFTHWVITGLAPTSTGIEAGEVPDGAVEARNDFGTAGWSGPCPPERHNYLFSMYVLPEPLGMVPDLDAQAAVGLVESATIQAISFTGSYGPAGP